MPDPLTRAKVYQERAAECVDLAALATTAATQTEYERLAAGYLKLAEAEMRLHHETKKASKPE